MESIIQSVIYDTAAKDVWCAYDVDIPYKKLSNLEKATYLVRQTFFLKYCKMLYGEDLPPIIEDYAKNIKQLLAWEYAITYKYNRPNTEDNIKAKMGLDIAKELLAKVYHLDNKLVLSYFEYDNPLVLEPIPAVASLSLVKTCLNYWYNLSVLNTRLPVTGNSRNNYKLEEITEVNIPKIEIDHTTLHIVDTDNNSTFMKYQFNVEMVTKLANASPNMYDDNNSLLCFVSCFDWTNKRVSDLFNIFAKNVMTLDVCNERCKQDVFGKYEYRNLWNTGAYYAIAGQIDSDIIDTNVFSSKRCPKLITSFLTLISILKIKYDLEIDEQKLINTMTNYSEEFLELLESKDDNMTAYDKYNASILPSIVGSSEADEEQPPPEEETEEIPEEDTPEEDAPKEDVPEEDAPEEEPPKEIKSSKTGDKSSPIDIELESKVTLDVVLLRDEITTFITNTVAHPPKGVSSTDLSVLLKLQQEWLNIFSIQTSLNIINKIVPCPIVVK